MTQKPRRSRPSKSRIRGPEEDDPELLEEDDEEVDGGPQIQPKLVSNFIRMWPRAIFNTLSEAQGRPGKPPFLARTIKALRKPGVYILYRDDQPFYVGQAKNGLGKRIWSHARSVGGLRTYFWNYFSAFVVEDVSQIDEVEAIIIAAMPAVVSNSAKPRLPRVRMDKQTKDVMRESRKWGRF
jgi:hypothetical protein